MTTTAEDRIFSGCYAAAAGRVGWHEPLTQVQQHLDLWGVQVVGVDKRSGGLIFSAESEDVTTAALDYMRFYHSSNPRLQPAIALQPDEWMHCHEHFDEAYVEGSPFYQDFLIPHGGRYLSGTKLHEDEHVLFLLGVMRGRGARPIGSDEMPFLMSLKHHMAEAMENILHQRHAYAQLEMAQGLLSRFRHAMFLIDPARGVWHQNRAATQLAAEGRWIAVREGNLLCRRAVDNNALTEVVHQLALDHPQERVGPEQRHVVRVLDDGGQPLMLFVSAVRPEHSSQLLGPHAKALVIAYDPSQQPEDPDPLVLAECFALTPAEARVASRIAAGESPKEVADRTGVSHHTVRSQLQAVMAKLGINRQAELVRAVNQLGGFA